MLWLNWKSYLTRSIDLKWIEPKSTFKSMGDVYHWIILASLYLLSFVVLTISWNFGFISSHSSIIFFNNFSVSFCFRFRLLTIFPNFVTSACKLKMSSVSFRSIDRPDCFPSLSLSCSDCSSSLWVGRLDLPPLWKVFQKEEKKNQETKVIKMTHFGASNLIRTNS